MRINTYLASQLGISRRAADRKIREGKVFVDGEIAVLGQTVDIIGSEIIFDETKVGKHARVDTTIILYKPSLYVTTRSDPQGRPTIMDLLPTDFQTLKPAGRLDYDSEGLVLLSNNGKLIYENTHPKFGTEKEYDMYFSRPVTSDLLDAFDSGIQLSEGLAVVDRAQQKTEYGIQVVIHQGWNRQLRRMALACDYEVTRLIRTRLGMFKINQLQPKEWVKL